MLKGLILALSMFASAAFAETVTLPEPTVVSVTATPKFPYGAGCFHSELLNYATTPYAQQELIGWLDDTHVAVYAYTPYSGVPCGGRRGIYYWPYSVVLVWEVTVDPSTGALNPIGTATYTPVTKAPVPTSNYNSLGYEITMVTECNPSVGCGYQSFWPTLVTP